MVYEVVENTQSKGIMSVLVTDNSRDVLRIEDWVLSCRAFSRGIEWWILWNIAKQLDSKGISLIRCQLNKTDRTSYIENFMEQIRAADLIDLDHSLKIKSILESEFVLNEIRGLVND
jgi:predicted enzyme involved in methoxymalonyl-ACP biosynthesis